MSNVPMQNAKILSIGEEKAIDKAVNDLKDIRDEVEIAQGVNFEAKNKGDINKKIADLERIKRNHSVPQLSDGERQKALTELRDLEVDLRRDMPTWRNYERSRPQDGAAHHAMVRLIVKWEGDALRRAKVQRWKTLRRLTNPDDPQASNVMYLFEQ